MSLLALLLLLPTVVQVYIFVLESLQWGQPRTNAVFGVKPEHVELMRPWAVNQGYYNLFLAFALFFGWMLYSGLGPEILDGGMVGLTLAVYGLASMFAAGVVLVATSPRRWRSALVQIVPSLVGAAGLAGALFVR